MHIKRCVIKGFKSFASLVDLEEFDSGSNVIVGPNGAGKSNFIDAIRFVLATDKFHRLRKEEVDALRHHGAGERTEFYVEIEFDNSDKRLPLDTAEVTLRRDFGSKADAFYLNGKRVSAEDVVNLLESAGFSRSNPYFIVLQGQVQQLTKMSPAERLDLLKEVAGTRVYDERREESLKILKETESKKEKIEEVLEMLNARLVELSSEKAELDQYCAVDRERRALEYTIYHHQLVDSHNKLSTIDLERADDSKNVADSYSELDKMHAETKSAEAELAEIVASMSLLEKRKAALLDDHKNLLESKTKLDFNLQDRETTQKIMATSKKAAAVQLKKIVSTISTENGRLKQVQKDFDAAVADEMRLSEELAVSEARLQDLYGRAGRRGQFKSVKERDGWIKKELADIKSQISKKEKMGEELKKTLQEFEQRRASDQALVSTRAAVIDQRRKALEKAMTTYDEAKSRRDDFNSKRKDLWREEAELDQSIQKHNESIRKAERRLHSTMTKELANGLATLERLKAEGLAPGVYGPIIDLFDCDDKYLTAVEVAAGNSLFHVVVDSDQTAANMVSALEDEKAGRVTFVPLNRLEIKPRNLPSTATMKPMLDVLQFNKSLYLKAFEQLFGKVVICSSIESAVTAAKFNKMTCITLDGDQVNGHGAMTGGFHDPSRSRLAAHRELSQLKRIVSDEKQKRQDLRDRINQIDQRITEAIDEVATAEEDRVRAREELDQFDADARTAAKQLLHTDESIMRTNRSLAELSVAIQALKETYSSLESELTTALDGDLSPEERGELQELARDLPELRKRVADVAQRRASLEAQKAEIEHQLGNHLLRKQDELESALASDSLPLEDDETHLRSSVERIEEEIAKLTALLEQIDSEREKAQKRGLQLRRNLETLKAKEQQAEANLQEHTRIAEKRLNKRGLLISKREEAQKKLREVGSLPADAIQQFLDKSAVECLALLQETNVRLKEFRNVNKKASDQYTSFKDQRESLFKRKQELDDSETAIENLIETLDRHKDEAIERTVKGVTYYFRDIFHSLTSGGTALLKKMHRSTVEVGLPEVVGIDIEVRFSPDKPPQKMTQLSGGQASIVALALIFAIQRCDPAPFYVFDEIDPALDDAHRRAVAKMIQQACQPQSVEAESEDGAKPLPPQHPPQFIITSHRPELVEVANKHYSIEFTNRMSSIRTIDREDALEIVRYDENSAVQDSSE